MAIRELKKIKVSRISIVTSGANKERFMIRKSIDEEDPWPSIPILGPASMIERITKNSEEKEEEEENIDDYPSIPIIGPASVINKMVERLPDEEEEEEEEEEEDDDDE